MDTLSMTKTKGDRWRSLMDDVRRAATVRCGWPKGYYMTLSALSDAVKVESPLYTTVRLGRIFRGALQVDANGAGKDITAAIRLIERAEEDGRITASQRAELFEIMGVSS